MKYAYVLHEEKYRGRKTNKRIKLNFQLETQIACTKHTQLRRSVGNNRLHII
jgi:hypothetical protein